jgi:hypothetical protein
LIPNYFSAQENGDHVFARSCDWVFCVLAKSFELMKIQTEKWILDGKVVYGAEVRETFLYLMEQSYNHVQKQDCDLQSVEQIA